MKNFKVLLLIAGLVASHEITLAQTTEEAQVKAVVENLFKAMQTGDSTLARKCFASQCTGATIYTDRAGKRVLRREESINQFVRAIGTPRTEVWYEEIWGAKVQIDGELATL
jgi:hypothetical protein